MTVGPMRSRSYEVLKRFKCLLGFNTTPSGGTGVIKQPDKSAFKYREEVRTGTLFCITLEKTEK